MIGARLVPGVLAAILLFTLAAAAREWTDRSGKHKTEATLVSVKDGKAYLEKAGGAVIAVPLANLSEADLEHLQSLPENEKYFAEHPLPTPPRKPGTRPKPVIHVDDPAKVGEVRRFGDMRWGVESLAFSPDGRLLAVGKMDNAVMVYDVDKSHRVTFLEKLENLGQVTCLAFTPDGRKLLAGGYSGRIQVWDVDSSGGLREANRFVGHSRAVHVICVSADGKFVLSGGEEKLLRYWELETAREQFAIEGFEGAIKAAYLTRGGKQGLGADGDSVILIDIKQGKAIQSMRLDSRSTQAIAIAPDGSRIAVSHLYAMRHWDIRTGKEFPLLQGQEIPWGAVFTPNSKYLLAGGRGKVSVWDVAAQRKLYEFDTAGTYYVKSIACSPDGRHFAAVPQLAGGDVQVFRLPEELAKD